SRERPRRAGGRAGVSAVGFAHHLLPEMRLGEGAVLACLVVLALILSSRVYGGVRHLRVGERLLIVGTSPLARLVVEQIARRPDPYAPVRVGQGGAQLDRPRAQ